MTPLQPIHNPLSAQMAAQNRWPMGLGYGMRYVRYKTGGHYEPDNSFQRHEIPIGRLIQLNPKLLK